MVIAASLAALYICVCVGGGGDGRLPVSISCLHHMFPSFAKGYLKDGFSLPVFCVGTTWCEFWKGKGVSVWNIKAQLSLNKKQFWTQIPSRFSIKCMQAFQEPDTAKL